jgi:cytochrome b561
MSHASFPQFGKRRAADPRACALLRSGAMASSASSLAPPHVERRALPRDRYDRIAVLLHWLMAVGVLAQLALGWWMLGVPKQPPGLRAGWFNLHKSIGMTLALLLLLRLAWRLAHRPPDFGRLLPAWQRRAARTTHWLLYACLVLMPLTGFLGSSFGRYPVLFFGHALPRWLPVWPAAKEAMSAVHWASAWLLMGLLGLHVGAALWHASRRDGVMRRMVWRFDR